MTRDTTDRQEFMRRRAQRARELFCGSCAQRAPRTIGGLCDGCTHERGDSRRPAAAGAVVLNGET